MKVDRLSVTMDPELGQVVRQEAARSGTSVSGWLSEAAAARVRNEGLGRALQAWQDEDGPPSEEDFQWAYRALGIEDDGWRGDG
ncbi:MAG: hypothetical protein MSC31_02860 [Solirubrobacteraceae bacterium MAG38_C4-C5]|nr:hypothetical protein [Candidatus Siliceabacter maunaloa]